MRQSQSHSSKRQSRFCVAACAVAASWVSREHGVEHVDPPKAMRPPPPPTGIRFQTPRAIVIRNKVADTKVQHGDKMS